MIKILSSSYSTSLSQQPTVTVFKYSYVVWLPFSKCHSLCIVIAQGNNAIVKVFLLGPLTTFRLDPSLHQVVC